MSGIEVAQATITVTPVLSGAQETLTKEMNSAAGNAGTEAGKSAGSNMMTSMGKQMTSVGKNMTATVTAPIMAIGTASAAAWKEVDTGLDTIIQKTGASGDELTSMRDILGNVTATIPTDFATAGEAIGEVNTRFGLTGDALEELSGQFIKFADLNGQDVSSSIDSVSGMMAAMGVEAGDAGRMLDALNVVGQQTGVDVGTLADTISSNAAQFKEMGLSVEDSAALLGQMSMAGLDSSTAMMGLKTAMKNATEDGESMQDALAGFDEIMQSNASESDKLAAAYELFGTRAGGAIYNAVSDGTLNLSDFTSSLEGFEGSVSETFAATQDPMDTFTTTMNQLKSVGADIFESVAPTLVEALQGIADIVETVSDKWNSLDEDTQEFIIKAAEIAAVVGPILAIGGKVSNLLTPLTGGLGGLIGKITGMGTEAGKAAGPVATAGGSFSSMAGGALQLVALGGSIALAGVGIKQIADAAVEVSAGGPAAIGTFFGMAAALGGLMAVAAALGPALDAGALGIAAFGGAMVGAGFGIRLASEGVSVVIDAIGRLVETVADNSTELAEFVVGIGDSIGEVVESVGNGIATVIDAISDGLSGVLDSIAGIIDSIGEAALNSGEGFEKLSNAVQDLVNNTGVLDLATTLGSVAGGVKDINKAAKDSADNAESVKKLGESFGTLNTDIMAATDTIKNFQSDGDSALSGITTTTDNLDNTFDTVANGIKTSLDGVSVALAGTRTDIDTTDAKFSTFSTSASSKLGDIQTAADNLDIAGSIDRMMNDAQTTAAQRINDLANMFSSTQFSFNQYIPLPHFSIWGSFDLRSGSVPSVTASWYAKAAEYGALFTKPQIIGVGDASQPELLLGEEKLKELVRGDKSSPTNVYVNGADSPDIWARKLVRAARQYERIM